MHTNHTKVIAFFNNKGGVGKTSLVYHISWMLAELDIRTLAVDLDPQANLSAAFLSEDDMETLWSEEEAKTPRTVYDGLRPHIVGTGDIRPLQLIVPSIDLPVDINHEDVSEKLHLLPGDIRLSQFEDNLSESWPKCADGDERSFRTTSAFWRLSQQAAKKVSAQLILMDLGPNLGAINRAALTAADFIVVPLALDLYSLQGLRNLGPRIREWRDAWGLRRKKGKEKGHPDEILLSSGANMQLVGYIVMQHAVRLDRPVKAYLKWAQRIPKQYQQAITNSTEDKRGVAPLLINDDPACIAQLKHYRSLMPLAQEARKPMFKLRHGDGALGGHIENVHQAQEDFADIAKQLIHRCAPELEPFIDG